MKLNKFFGAAAALLLCTVSAAFAQNANAFMLYESGSLWTENASGEMKWDHYVKAGDKFTAYQGTQKDATRISSSGNATRNFIKVSEDGKDFWVQTSQVALLDGSAEVALLLDDAVVYETLDIINPSSTVLNKHTVVCSTSAETVGLSSITLKKIYYYDSVYKGEVVQGYVLESKVLAGESHLKLFRALNDVKNTKDAKAQSELFSNIMLMNPAPELYAEVEEVRNAIYGSDLSYGGNVELDTDSVSVEYTVICDDNVKVRSLPGTRGDVVDTIGSYKTQNTTFKALRRTVLTETIEGVTDHWYYLDLGDGRTSGWVFGSFLHLERINYKSYR